MHNIHNFSCMIVFEHFHYFIFYKFQVNVLFIFTSMWCFHTSGAVNALLFLVLYSSVRRCVGELLSPLLCAGCRGYRWSCCHGCQGRCVAKRSKQNSSYDVTAVGGGGKPEVVGGGEDVVGIIVGGIVGISRVEKSTKITTWSRDNNVNEPKNKITDITLSSNSLNTICDTCEHGSLEIDQSSDVVDLVGDVSVDNDIYSNTRDAEGNDDVTSNNLDTCAKYKVLQLNISNDGVHNDSSFTNMAYIT